MFLAQPTHVSPPGASFGGVAMITIAALVIAVIVLAGLAVLQALVAAGRPYGRLVWGGEHRVLPRRLRIGRSLAVLLYAVIAAVLTWRSGLLGTSGDVARIAGWIVFAFLAVSVAPNLFSKSRLERVVMTPTPIVLALCALVTAIS